MKRIFSILLVMVLMLNVFSLFVLSEGNETEKYGCLYILSKDMISEDDVKEILGDSFTALRYPEFINGENLNSDRYFLQISVKNAPERDIVIDKFKSVEGVIDVWTDAIVYANNKPDYCAHRVMVYTAVIPEMGSADENGLYNIFGVDCVAVDYGDSEYGMLVIGGNVYIDLFLPEDTDENKAIEILLQNENVISADLLHFEYISANPDIIPGNGETTEIFGDIFYPTADLNGNGKIDEMDYVLIKRAYFGTYELSEEEFREADVNGNGEIDSIDYTLVKRAFFDSAVRELFVGYLI